MNLSNLWCVTCSQHQPGYDLTFSVNKLTEVIERNLKAVLRLGTSLPLRLPEPIVWVCETEEEARSNCRDLQLRRDGREKRRDIPPAGV